MRNIINFSKKGFTLVELAIVLVIVGLLIAGVLAGQGLLSVAKERKLIAEFENIKLASESFRLKYNAIPGDMRNATAFWGQASGGCPNGARSGTQTCDGNGSKTVNWAEIPEPFLFWQHLANAKLIAGEFTGFSSTGGGYDHVIGTNAPRSSVYENAGFSINTFFVPDIISAAGCIYNRMPYTSVFLSLGSDSTSNPWPMSKVLEVETTRNIDEKIDDGKPSHGLFAVLTCNLNDNSGTPVCATENSYSNDLTAKCFNYYSLFAL